MCLDMDSSAVRTNTGQRQHAERNITRIRTVYVRPISAFGVPDRVIPVLQHQGWANTTGKLTPANA